MRIPFRFFREQEPLNPRLTGAQKVEASMAAERRSPNSAEALQLLEAQFKAPLSGKDRYGLFLLAS
jgi:hypothetical protein